MSADVTMSSFQYLQQLDDLTFTDNQADIIEAPAIAIAYCNTSDLNYSDDRLYALPSNALQYFSKESGWMAKLRDQLELGQRMLALLYSYRAVSRGIPQVSYRFEQQFSDFVGTKLGTSKPTRVVSDGVRCARTRDWQDEVTAKVL